MADTINDMVKRVCHYYGKWALAIYTDGSYNKSRVKKVLGKFAHQSLKQDGAFFLIRKKRSTLEKVAEKISEEGLRIQLVSPEGEVLEYGSF